VLRLFVTFFIATSSSSQSNTYIRPTDYALCKPWGGWYQFLLSYGLKPHNLDDEEEGKRILEAFREQDRREWEEAQNSKK
jgi:hypothetical protein